ncbi:MAG TPA: hypothetical protein VI792_05700 [Candidatus Eisenbacteria bacterium]
MSRRGGWTAALAVAALLALRVAYARHLEFDSDEPQHLHVAWAWTRGLVPYRDVFDNHAPLFALASAPLLARLGERADVLVPMRLALFPVFALVLAALGWIGNTLFSPRAARWGVVLAALWPEHFLTSLEYRPDALWSALWIASLAVLLAGRLRPARAAWAGLLAGAALGVSLKTVLLLATLAAAAPLALAAAGTRAPRRLASCVAAYAAGLAVIPAGIAAGFAARGSLGALADDAVRHNLLPGLGPGARALIFPAACVPLAWVARRVGAAGPDRALGARRAAVLLSAGLYLAALESFWPLLTPQDFLPFEPLALLLVAAWLVPGATAASARAARGRVATAALVALAELGVLVAGHPPWRDGARPGIELVRDALRLTRPDETVMDLKGEMIYRPRAVFLVLESVTRERIRRGLIADSIPERLVETRTAVVANDSRFFPPRARAFMDTSYVGVGRLRVAGRVLEVGGGTPRAFHLPVPGRYAVLAPGGPGRGRIDGRPWADAGVIAAGEHVYDPAPGEARVAVLWARAAESGYAPWSMENRRP